MSLPKRPATLAELEASLAAGTLQEGQHLEFKRELPSNKEIARQCAALAVQGGVLVLGVEETSTGFVGSPIDYIGVREKVGQIAQDTPEPPVELESLVLHADEPGKGVVWVEIAPSPHMLHQVGGRYYKRDDARTRPMSHAEVTDRIALREARPHMLKQGIEKALQRPEPAGTPLHARTCVVARPIGAAPDELFARTNTTEEWDNFAYDLMAPTGPILMPAPVRAWGFISHQATPGGNEKRRVPHVVSRHRVRKERGARASVIQPRARSSECRLRATVARVASVPRGHRDHRFHPRTHSTVATLGHRTLDPRREGPRWHVEAVVWRPGSPAAVPADVPARRLHGVPAWRYCESVESGSTCACSGTGRPVDSGVRAGLRHRIPRPEDTRRLTSGAWHVLRCAGRRARDRAVLECSRAQPGSSERPRRVSRGPAARPPTPAPRSELLIRLRLRVHGVADHEHRGLDCS